MIREVACRPIGSSGLSVSELGFGAAPLGNLYRPMSESDAQDAVRAALAQGLRYFDTAPYYGFGLSERRVGDALRGVPDYAISTKVGRLLRPAPHIRDETPRHDFCSSMPFEPEYDYGYEGVMRSWEASLQRLGLARIDILYVHDIGRRTHGDDHRAMFDQLTHGGGFRALERLRAGGSVRALGVGLNEIDACLEAMQCIHLDVVLLAGRYTLLEQHALDVLLPCCRASGTMMVVGAPYNSGILATGTRQEVPPYYDYGVAPVSIVERVRRIEACCDRHGVALAAAALKFPLAHPQVASVIPGIASVHQIEQSLTFYRTEIPDVFWQDLKFEGLLHPEAPVPARAAAP